LNNISSKLSSHLNSISIIKKGNKSFRFLSRSFINIKKRCAIMGNFKETFYSLNTHDPHTGENRTFVTKDENAFLRRLRELAGMKNDVEVNISKVENETNHADTNNGMTVRKEKYIKIFSNKPDELIDLAIRAGLISPSSDHEVEDNEHECPCGGKCQNSEEGCPCGGRCGCQDGEERICPCQNTTSVKFKPIRFDSVEELFPTLNTRIDPTIHNWLAEKSQILKNLSMDQWPQVLEDFVCELMTNHGYDRKEAEAIVSHLVDNYRVNETFSQGDWNSQIPSRHAMVNTAYVGSMDKRVERDLYNRYIHARYGDNPLENKTADELDIWSRYTEFVKNYRGKK